MIPQEQLHVITSMAMSVMQVSIVVPMAVVWGRRRHFPPVVKLLSAYVYLSALSALAIHFLYPAYFTTNLWMITGFNFGKIALLGAVYNRVLESRRMRQVLRLATLAALASIIGVYWFDALLGVAYSRITQCAVLAAVAMAYLEQALNRPPTRRAFHDPLWLLSVGQLVYSAGTVTAFSQDYLTVTIYDQNWKYLLVAFAGLVFNGFLTLAFLRAQRHHLAPTDLAGGPAPLARPALL